MFFLIQFFIIKRLFAEYEYQFKKVWITENETIPLGLQSLIILINNLQDILPVENLKQNISLYSEVKRYGQMKIKASEIYVLHNNNNNKLDLCFIKDNSISCSCGINNFLIDNELIIELEETKSISLKQKDCQNLVQIASTYYMVQCPLNQTNYLFSIINDKGDVFAIIELQIRPQCIGIFKYAYEKLLFFEKMCKNPKFLLINVDISALLFQKEIHKIKINDEMLTKDLMDQKLLDANYCIQNLIIMNFEYSIIEYNLGDQTIYFQRMHDKKIYGFYEKCNPLLFINFKENQTRHLDFSVNTELENIQQSLIVNDNLILLMDNKITILNNQFHNQTLPGFYTNIQALNQLPYIVCQSLEGDLIFYKINQYQSWFQYMQSTYLVIYQKNKWELQSLPIIVVQTYLYNLNNPGLILTENQIQLNFSTQQNIIQFSLLSISQGLPPAVGNLNNLHSIQQIFASNCSYQNYVRIQRIVYLENNNFALIFVDNSNILNMINCQTKDLYIIPLNSNSKILNIFTQISNLKFAVLTSDSIYYVKINSSFKIKLEQLILEQNQNLKIKQTGSVIYVLFENCTTIHLFPETISSLFHDDYFYENCTSTFDSYNSKIFVNDSVIIYRNNFDYILKSNNSISANSDGKYLLVYEIIKNVFKMKVFFLGNTLFFLYELPTYNYTIQEPIQVQFLQKYYLMIAAIDQIGNAALLVYDITQQASSCLQHIIPFDNGIYQFGFTTFNEKISVWFVLDGKIMLYNLIETYLYLDQLVISDEYQIQIQIDLSIISKIPSDPQVYKIIINYPNQVDNLRFKLKTNSKTLNINNQDSNSIILNNIYGSIVSIMPLSEEFTIQPPLVQFNLNMNCSFFSFGFCFINQTLYFYHQSTQKIIFQSNTISKIIDIDMMNENEFHIFYFDQKHQLLIMKYFQNLSRIESIDQIKYEFHQEKDVIILNKDMILFQMEQFQGLYYFHRPSLRLTFLLIEQYSCLGSQPLEQGVYLFVLFDQKEKIYFQKKTFVFSTQNNQIQHEGSVDFTLLTPILFRNIQILNYILIEEKLQIEFLAAEQLKPDWYIYEVMINFTNNHVIDHKIINYFRFGVYRHFIQPLIYNDKFVIFNFKLGIQNYILFYDISIRNQSEILDPIYEINSNISGIKQYNLTHYATITEQNGYQIVDFIIIDKYRIKCHQMCKNITYHIKIKNKDSELILEVLNTTTVNRSKIENQGHNLELTTIQKTIIVNLVVIILVCLLKKPRRLDRFQTVQK